MKFSILTPSFNSAKYLQRTIDSVLKQDYKNWEHIVMDGASTDGTVDILKKNLHLIWVSEKDNGQSDAMNKAFKKATGDVIMYLNADDELADGILSTMATQFVRFPDADMVVGDLQINNQGKITIKRPSVSLRVILQYWPCRFPQNPVSYAYKKSLQEKIGPFPIDNHYAMDYWFILEAYRLGKVVKFEKVGGTFHVDGTNKSSDLERGKKQLKTVRDNFMKRNFYHPAVIAFFARKIYRKIVKA
jgi:glycosyltransferase involved in cell wall biosynthesis